MRAALVLLAVLGLGQAAGAQTLEDPEEVVMPSGRADATADGFAAWLMAWRGEALEAGVPAAVWDREMRSAEFLPDVIRRDRSQNEFTKTIWDYLDIAVSEERVVSGRKMLKTHARLLERIEAEYGVEKEVLVAIWGLESSYGGWRGTTDTVSALATLAYDGRRGAFFGAQLVQALKIIDAGHVSRKRMQGSWAGAMGHTQFMPTSWAEFAVDFDKDGLRNLWGDDPADALASAGNYLKHWGWTTGQAWGYEIRLPGGFDYDQSTERVKKPVSEWQALGVRLADGDALTGEGEASVLLPAGSKGPAFLIFPNFQVIEHYNLADAYVIAVGHLSDRLKDGPPIRAEWPRQWRALTLEERKELQALLTEAGFDAGGVDGRIGPKTIAAVKAWQKAEGHIPDGYPGEEALAALRAP